MIPGLHYALEVLTETEETALVATVNAHPWSTAMSRRVQQYGHAYVYRAGTESDSVVAPVPAWALDLLERCRTVLPVPAVDRQQLQVIVNEYTPGQGIAPHIDSPRQFGDWVLSVSVGSPATMVFSKGAEKVPVVLDRRSAYLMTGEARWCWKHGIPGRKGDRTGTRISVTFRVQRRVQVS
jgi:alkylated DNA repair dioxygenase AlkB